MDYFKTIKSLLENEGIIKAIKNLKLDPEVIEKAANNSNLCCSNDTFLFIYLEQAASFIALSFNRLCKSDSNNSIVESIQRLTINTVPVGEFKKCLMNNEGTHILVVYDKCFSVVELPSKWGKYDQYNGGSLIMCKSIKLSYTSEITDALWHRNIEKNQIICLSKDNFIRVFNAGNLKFPIKEYHLENLFHNDEDREKNLRSEDENKSINMGHKFIHNGKYAYPIYVMKSSGQIECLLDYGGAKNFKSLGELQLFPSSELLEDTRIVSFTCLPIQPNCLVLLMENFSVYHCLFMNRMNSLDDDDKNDNNRAYEDHNEFNDEAMLYIFENIKLDSSNNIQNIQFLLDPSNSSRYFIQHETGVHSVYLPWLERLQISYLNHNKINSIELDATSSCEINHLISNRPFYDRLKNSYMIGLTVLYGFGNTSNMLIGLDNQGSFKCINIQTSSNFEEAKTRMLSDVQVDQVEDTNEFTKYIASILKRQINLPVLIGKDEENLSENELNLFMKQIINLLKFEHIEKQKLVMLEFKKRKDLLKQQEKLQFDIIKETESKIKKLNESMSGIETKYKDYNYTKEKHQQKIKDCFEKLLEKRPLPMNDNEKEIYKELNLINNKLTNYNSKLEKNKQLINQNESLLVKQESTMDSSDEEKLINLIKNESEKIKHLMSKVEKLKATIKI